MNVIDGQANLRLVFRPFETYPGLPQNHTLQQ